MSQRGDDIKNHTNKKARTKTNNRNSKNGVGKRHTDERSSTRNATQLGTSRTSSTTKTPENHTSANGNIFDVQTKGKNYKVNADVYFGEIGKRSKKCKLIVDSGSQLTWVTKQAYEEAARGINIPEKKGTFILSYGNANTKNILRVSGKLYEGTVSFFDTKGFVQKQIFGIVHEKDLHSEFKANLDHFEAKGVLGLGSNLLDTMIQKYDTDGKAMKACIPTLLDNLKTYQRIPERIIGITISLPSEIKNGPIDKRVLTGELHFGRAKDGAYDKKTMKEIPTVIGGALEYHYAVHLKLKCGNEDIMSRCEGVIDTGIPHIYLPSDVMKKYMNKVKKETGRDVVKFDKNTELYYLAKKDFKHLKDLEFEFSDGEGNRVGSFMLSPTAQVFPPALSSENLPQFDDNSPVYFVIKNFTSPNYSFNLGAAWMMWYYIVLESRKDHKKVRIAEINDRRGYRWIGLEG